ncbi:SGNH/GDSL hydrolase family protein [Polymorphospora rubra]|uniref:SGNH/GDSL hydrolase family protein n=1 Tax=Polymorphospora rubra TaxID=338584 RepID=UPI0033DB628E
MARTRTATLLAGLVAGAVVALGLGAPAQAAAGEHYVSLGDSYASGVGAGSYTAESGGCKRSLNAFPQLWANANAPASYRSVACSGAKTGDVVNSQLSALSSTTTLVSVVIGGNDVGFANIMTTCALAGTNACLAAVTSAENLARTSLPGWLDNVYNGIKNRAPNADVVVLGYPTFYQLGTPICLGLSEQSRAKINSGINLANDIISAAAARHGFTFGDVRPPFIGHQLCSGDKWLHAVNFADIGVSYHPTANGQSGGYLPVFRSAATLATKS